MNPIRRESYTGPVGEDFPQEYPLIHIIAVGYPAKFSAGPVKFPATVRAGIGPRRRTCHRDIFHEILLTALRTTVTFHAVSAILRGINLVIRVFRYAGSQVLDYAKPGYAPILKKPRGNFKAGVSSGKTVPSGS